LSIENKCDLCETATKYRKRVYPKKIDRRAKLTPPGDTGRNNAYRLPLSPLKTQKRKNFSKTKKVSKYIDTQIEI
jgi:hypothetical protein